MPSALLFLDAYLLRGDLRFCHRRFWMIVWTDSPPAPESAWAAERLPAMAAVPVLGDAAQRPVDLVRPRLLDDQRMEFGCLASAVTLIFI